MYNLVFFILKNSSSYNATIISEYFITLVPKKQNYYDQFLMSTNYYVYLKHSHVKKIVILLMFVYLRRNGVKRNRKKVLEFELGVIGVKLFSLIKKI